MRKQWGQLTDDDVDQIQGDAEILVGKLQERYGRTRDQARDEINRFLKAIYGRSRIGYQHAIGGAFGPRARKRPVADRTIAFADSEPVGQPDESAHP
jgi:uncharacterized protein YjbJ (UPF0337 family)